MLDVKRMQGNLGVVQDGQAGPLTYTALFGRLGAPGGTMQALGAAAAIRFPQYGISDTALRLIHFCGQTALETNGYVFLREIWGPTAAQRGYEGRKDLGNTQPGDGRKFLGRGVLQVTGRANYRVIGERMDVDLEAAPSLLEQPGYGLWAACLWWQDNNANAWADRDDALAVSRLVNRGNARSTKPANHEADRLQWTAMARKLITG